MVAKGSNFFSCSRDRRAPFRSELAWAAALALLWALLPTFGASVAFAQADAEPEDGETFTEAGESGAVLPEMVVEAENEVRQDIRKSAFEFELSAASVDSFFSATDDEALSVSPVSGLQPHLNNLERLASDQPPHPWLPRMASRPMATFYPQETEGHSVGSWTLTITDFRGTPFKIFQGKGTPPERLDWNGQGDNGEMLEPGYPYSYVFSIIDKGTNTYNHAGVSFRVPAMDYRGDGDRVLELAGDELFSPADAKLRAAGRDWLTAACDVVRRHPYSPVRVRVVAEDQSLAEQRADTVASFLASSMIVPREQIETEAEQRPDLRAELDGVVHIVVEHAD